MTETPDTQTTPPRPEPRAPIPAGYRQGLVTAITVLLSLELGATLLLFGAQVIAEWERFGAEKPAPHPFRT